MKKILLLALLLTPAMVRADPGPLDDLTKKCEKEKTSMFKDNEGTPSCDKLAKIYADFETRTITASKELRKKCDKEQKSLFKENNGTPSCQKLNDFLRDRAAFPVGQKYGLNKETGQYCYFNDAGDVLNCP
ncbi:hypothetical protein RAM80_07375 [Pseudomonas sp. App30]|uniref:hypothetical protein n=1 Tax=Pseudomonas sp. App30 TaxID=3068990 RepID=UPI003A7FE012